MTLLEIACFNVTSALLAAHSGADRIELCVDQAAGGTTPPVSWLEQVKPEINIPVYVMIRPRGGNFTYSDDEFDVMKTSIAAMKYLADGFVFGILDTDGRVDVARTSELVRLADPLPCTFHRAFDETPNLMEALEDVVGTGCRAILTSGGKSSAVEGVAALGELVRRAEGRVVVMPGGGVRAGNVVWILEGTGPRAVHSSGITDGGEGVDGDEVRLMKQLVQQRCLA